MLPTLLLLPLLGGAAGMADELEVVPGVGQVLPDGLGGGKVVAELEVSSPELEVEQRAGLPRYPYTNSYQLRRDQGGLGGLVGGQQARPTLESLNTFAAQQGKTVTTPEELLDQCCQANCTNINNQKLYWESVLSCKQ